MADAELSFALPDESTVIADALDVAALADFEDEAALINDLLTSEASAGLGISGQDGSGPSAPREDGEEPMLSLLELDVKLGRLLGVLESACQDTSAQVERAIEDVSRAVPRLTFDLQLMRENVILLRFTLDSIRKRSLEATAHNETSQVMRRLKVLDTIKTRMEAARDVLREAEAWSTLESEVTALVQEQAYVKAAERLAEASKSMVVFEHTPEYETRRSLMVSLQNGLEAGLSASLVAAINARDVKACKNYYGIFGQIQRETEFRNYYFGSRRAHLLREWQSARLSDCLTPNLPELPAPSLSAPPTTFSNYLPTFYNNLANTINDERSYIPAIFPDPLDTLCSFLQTTLDSLVPSFPQRLSDLSNSHGSRLLLELIKLYHSTEEFAVGMDRSFTKLSISLAVANETPSTPGATLTTPSPSTPISASIKKSRRSSKGMSISRRLSRGGLAVLTPATHLNGINAVTEEVEPIRAWETSLFEPFLDWQAEYADLESRLLRSELSRLTNGQDAMAFLLASSGDEADELSGKSRVGTKLLLEQTLAVFTLAEEALGRTMAFTHGYGAAGFVEAVDGVLKTFLSKERDTLLRAKDSRLRRKGGADPTKPSEGDMQLEYTEDWSTFQLALRLLEACRTIWERTAAFETKVRTRLVDVARLMKDARQDPVNQILPGTTRGALALLWQSTLNSVSLASLLDSLDQTPIGFSSPLLIAARSASTDLTRASQLFLHDTILAPIMQTLEVYSSLPAWTLPSDARPEARGAFDLHIPTFSLSPSETITRVGEGLFNLPGMFEVYAEDDALAFSIETLPGLDIEMIKHLKKEQGLQDPSHKPSLPTSAP